MALQEHPTNPFTISKLQDQEICEFYVVQERRATNSKARKLFVGRAWAFFSQARLLMEILFRELSFSLFIHDVCVNCTNFINAVIQLMHNARPSPSQY